MVDWPVACFWRAAEVSFRLPLQAVLRVVHLVPAPQVHLIPQVLLVLPQAAPARLPQAVLVVQCMLVAPALQAMPINPAR